MIKKESRENGFLRDTYNLRVYDKNGNDFLMTVGGNGDLYWLPANYKNVKSFCINKEDELFYAILQQLFCDIKEKDDKYRPTLDGDKFTFISEDCHEDEAHRLEIVKEENEFVINFLRNPNEHLYAFPKRGCNICFCNSGSRVPKVEQLFMLMFNELAYYNDEIELEQE